MVAQASFNIFASSTLPVTKLQPLLPSILADLSTVIIHTLPGIGATATAAIL